MAEIITLGPADDGKSVETRVGDTVVVRLPENPTTGFQWHLDPLDNDIVVSAGDSFSLAGEPAFGSGGTREFRFSARSPGDVRISLKLARSWAADQPPAQTFSLRVTAAE